MPIKTLSLTIVIPIYNEEGYLKDCLDSIAAQSIMPDEVIVVDNNSTDASAQIAGGYHFVRVIKEPNQHQSFAQKTGFNAAKSDIIGRIDADSILPANWVKNTVLYFIANPEAVGITGSTLPYDTSSARFGRAVFSFYISLAGKLAGHRMLWGANCAIRRSAWRKISHKVTTRGDIWEDYDLSFCLAEYGQINTIDSIDIDSSFRAAYRSLITQTRYQFRAVRTFYLRKNLAVTAAFFAAWSTLFLIFIPVMLDKYVLRPIAEAIRTTRNASSKPSDIVPFETE